MAGVKPNKFVEALRAWCKTESRELPIEETYKTLEAYDVLAARIQQLERERNAVQSELAVAIEDRNGAEGFRDEAEKELNQARAEGAVMREVIRFLHQYYQAKVGDDYPKVVQALSTTCGQDFMGSISEKNKWLRACLYSIEKHAVPFPSLDKLKACISDDTGHGVIKQAILDRDMEWWSALVLVDNVAPTPEAAKDWLLRLSEYERQPILETLKECVGDITIAKSALERINPNSLDLGNHRVAMGALNNALTKAKAVLP